MTRPSIAELQAWSGEPDYDEADGSYACLRCSCTMVLAVGYEPSPMCNACAQWLVSDAAPVLLEIAAAALAYEQAKIDAAVIRYTYSTADDRRTVGAQRIEAHDREEIRCRDAYRAALAKVAP